MLKDVVSICPGEEGNVGRGQLPVGEKGRAGRFFELRAEGSQTREERLERCLLLLLVCFHQHAVVWAAALSVDLMRARVSTHAHLLPATTVTDLVGPDSTPRSLDWIVGDKAVGARCARHGVNKVDADEALEDGAPSVVYERRDERRRVVLDELFALPVVVPFIGPLALLRTACSFHQHAGS